MVGANFVSFTVVDFWIFTLVCQENVVFQPMNVVRGNLDSFFLYLYMLPYDYL